jgi:hypothetical protein
MHIIGMIRTGNRDYFSKQFSGVVMGMHIAYRKMRTEILNIWYNKLYIQKFKQIMLIYVEETKDKKKF